MKKYKEVAEQLSKKAELLPKADFDLDYYIIPEAEPQTSEKFFHRPFSIRKYAAAALAAACVVALTVSLSVNGQFRDTLASLFTRINSIGPSQTDTVSSGGQTAGLSVFAPNTVTEVRQGISREDYADFYRYCRDQGQDLIIPGTVISTVKSMNQEMDYTTFYKYVDDTISQVQCQNYSAEITYKDQSIPLNFQYTICNGQLNLFQNTKQESGKYTIVVNPVTSRTDLVLLKIFPASSSDLQTVELFNIQNHSVYDVFGDIYYTRTSSTRCSPGGNKIRFMSKKDGSSEIENYYLDLNSMQVKDMGFKETLLDETGADEVGFVSWIDDDNVLYYDNYNGTACNLMRMNLTTGEKTLVIQGVGNLSDVPVLFSQNQQLIIKLNGTVWYYNVMTGEKRKIPEFNSGSDIKQIQLSPDGKYLAFIYYQESTGYSKQFGILDLDAFSVTLISDDRITDTPYIGWLAKDALGISISDPISSSVNTIDWNSSISDSSSLESNKGFFTVYKINNPE